MSNRPGICFQVVSSPTIEKTRVRVRFIRRQIFTSRMVYKTDFFKQDGDGMDGASPSTTIYALPAEPFVYSSGWACPIHANMETNPIHANMETNPKNDLPE